MGKGKMHPQELNWDDPDFVKKGIVIQNTNYLHDKTREDGERLYTRVFFSISLAITLLASFYDGDYKWHAFFILTAILDLMILFSLNSYRKKRLTFWDNRDKKKKTHQFLNLDFPD